MASTDGEAKPSEKSRNLVKYTLYAGIGLLVVSVAAFLIFFRTVITQEVEYYTRKDEPLLRVQLHWPGSPITMSDTAFIDPDFGIAIPKIRAFSKVVPNVDPNNPDEYQWALTEGAAHAEGSALPNEPGNTFIFSHSSANFYEAAKYNSVFYLLNKIKVGDDFYVSHDGKLHKYDVGEVLIVEPDEIDYIKGAGALRGKTVTLMTCWPPGTTLKRLIVIGHLEEVR